MEGKVVWLNMHICILPLTSEAAMVTDYKGLCQTLLLSKKLISKHAH